MWADLLLAFGARFDDRVTGAGLWLLVLVIGCMLACCWPATHAGCAAGFLLAVDAAVNAGRTLACGQPCFSCHRPALAGKLEAFAANARIVHIDIDPAEVRGRVWPCCSPLPVPLCLLPVCLHTTCNYTPLALLGVPPTDSHATTPHPFPPCDLSIPFHLLSFTSHSSLPLLLSADPQEQGRAHPHLLRRQARAADAEPRHGGEPGGPQPREHCRLRNWCCILWVALFGSRCGQGGLG